jgi:RES domain-containing protein
LKAWRITNKDYVADAFSGKGAFLYAGRWNSAGVRLVYLGGTPSISVLETLVNVPSLSVLATLEFVLIPVDFEDSLITDVVLLPPDRNSFPLPISTVTIGDQWVNSRRSLILKAYFAKGVCQRGQSTILDRILMQDRNEPAEA